MLLCVSQVLPDENNLVKTYLPLKKMQTLCQMLVQRMDFHNEVQRKFQYMFMPHHRNAGQNHSIDGNISFENIAKLKYLTMAETCQNYIH